MSVTALTAEDIEWLVCPACHQPLALEAAAVRCACCNHRYPIVDGIPILIADRADATSTR